MYDPQEAVRWLVKSASQDFDIAQYRLGKMFLCGDEIPKDADYALRWLWKAEAQNNQYAQYLLGKTYLGGEDVGQDIAGAEQLFEKASVQGSPYAKYALAKMHLDGIAENSSTDKAVFLLREAADSKYDVGTTICGWSEYLLGKFYLRGENVEKNPLEAERLLNSAAGKKNSQAQYLLGKLYLSEDGIPKDTTKAVHFLTESANQGNQYAQYQLGKMYLYGKEVPQDYELGIRLLTASAAQGNEWAAKVLQNYHSGYKPSSAFASLRLLAHLSQLLRDNIRRDQEGQKLQTEKKLMQKIEEKKQAHGLKMG